MSGAQLTGWTTESWSEGFDVQHMRTDSGLTDAWNEGESLDPESAVEMALRIG